MIDTLQFATLGVAPGHSTYNTATLGFGFEIEVTISLVDIFTGQISAIDLYHYVPLTLDVVNTGSYSEVVLTDYPHIILHLDKIESGEEGYVDVSNYVRFDLDIETGDEGLSYLTTYPKEPELRGGGPIEYFDSRREVIVTVIFRGESYSKHLFFDIIALNNTIKVIATFLSIKKRIIEVLVEMKSKSKKGLRVVMNKLYK